VKTDQKNAITVLCLC